LARRYDVRIYNGRLFTPLPGLRRIRNARDLSVRELAKEASVGYVNILRIENEQQKATMSSFEKLAIALKVESLEELLLDDESFERLAESRGELLTT
jgi:transcriptional regulator with XRE-family HTH domain